MEHCPSDCHSHIITDVSDVKSGTFDAPDHEYPSHIKLSLTVTDSDGLTASDEVEIFPKTGTVAATSDPTGIPLTVSASTAIVGSSISVSAPATAVLGEDTWAFSSWSDGGARTHGVPGHPGRQEPRRPLHHDELDGPLGHVRRLARGRDPVQPLDQRHVRQDERRRLVSVHDVEGRQGPARPGRPDDRRPDGPVQRLHDAAADLGSGRQRLRGDHPQPGRRHVRREADRQRDRLHAAVRDPRASAAGDASTSCRAERGSRAARSA